MDQEIAEKDNITFNLDDPADDEKIKEEIKKLLLEPKTKCIKLFLSI